ncbi:phosphotransferase [Streptomyces sp. NPDC053048]|uniref:phosphotransferase n=1 Tax=Streptomyces sp. NPDC053048 TaxID=3365694 RepID=UPI0037D02C42
MWLHGDLKPTNLLVREGKLHTVIDFGGLSVGFPDAEHSTVWDLPPQARQLNLDDLLGPRPRLDGRGGRQWGLVLLGHLPRIRRRMPSTTSGNPRRRRYAMRNGAPSPTRSPPGSSHRTCNRPGHNLIDSSVPTGQGHQRRKDRVRRRAVQPAARLPRRGR